MAQHGNELLVKVGDGGDPESFATICGLTSRSIDISADEFDVTVTDCSDPTLTQYKSSLGGARGLSVSGSGRFVNKAQMVATIARIMTKDNSGNYEVVLPGLGTFTAAFRLSGLGFAGDDSGELTQSFSMNSTGPITFTEE